MVAAELRVLADTNYFQEKFMENSRNLWGKARLVTLLTRSQETEQALECLHNSSHNEAHLLKVSQHYLESCASIPEVVQLTEEWLEPVVVGGLIACGRHDDSQVRTGSKILHPEIGALDVYFELWSMREALDLTDKEIYIAASCIYFHTFDNALVADTHNYQMPPPKEILHEIEKTFHYFVSGDLSRFWPNYREIKATIERDEFEPYPEVPSHVMKLAERRMMLADEMDALIPPTWAITRMLTTDPNRFLVNPDLLNVTTGNLQAREWIQFWANAQGIMFPDDLSRFLHEQARFPIYREKLDMLAYESSKLKSALKQRFDVFRNIMSNLFDGATSFLDQMYGVKMQTIVDNVSVKPVVKQQKLWQLELELQQTQQILLKKKPTIEELNYINKMLEAAENSIEFSALSGNSDQNSKLFQFVLNDN